MMCEPFIGRGVSDGHAGSRFDRERCGRRDRVLQEGSGAVELVRLPGPDGKHILHAALRIGEATLFLGDEFAEVRGPDAAQSPKSLGGTSVTLRLQSPDVDATMAAAIARGPPSFSP